MKNCSKFPKIVRAELTSLVADGYSIRECFNDATETQWKLVHDASRAVIFVVASFEFEYLKIYRGQKLVKNFAYENAMH